MSNLNVKIVYSLKLHIALMKQGFQYVTEMRNPKDVRYSCWVYEASPEFLEAFDNLLREAGHDGK